MFVVYIVVAIFVMVLLLSIPLFPFWKVWMRMQTHHRDIWQSAGPFDPRDMIRSPGLIGIFIQVLMRMETDKDLLARDPTLIRWVRISMEILRVIPLSIPARIGYLIVFLYFAYRLTRLLLS
jgi:hypothetical protein